VPNARVTRGMERPGTETRRATMELTPAAAPRSEMGRRVEQLVGRYLATDGARLNFQTHIHVRASHYRLSAGSATRVRPPAGEHELSMQTASASQTTGEAQDDNTRPGTLVRSLRPESVGHSSS
jgi:hypothetical protein